MKKLIAQAKVQKEKLLAIVVGLIIIGGAWYYATAIHVNAFAINKSDTISSWTFKGAYTGNDTLIQKANDDITHLTSLLGKGQYDNYDLYLGIANDYELMGDGAKSYDYYNRSAKVHPTKGLVYANMGYLFEQLNAPYTAADAYAKAVAVEPSVLEYHIERITFLTQAFPNDTVRLGAAFADASKGFGDTPPILAIEAQWLTEQKRYADAIVAWQQAKTLSPGKDNSTIDREIARLKLKQAGK